jgi:hypothetical protein
MVSKDTAIQGSLGEVVLSEGRPLRNGERRLVMRDTETGEVVGELVDSFITRHSLDRGDVLELWAWEKLTTEMPKEFSLTSPED